jgi:hypothetical protein
MCPLEFNSKHLLKTQSPIWIGRQNVTVYFNKNDLTQEAKMPNAVQSLVLVKKVKILCPSSFSPEDRPSDWQPTRQFKSSPRAAPCNLNSKTPMIDIEV